LFRFFNYWGFPDTLKAFFVGLAGLCILTSEGCGPHTPIASPTARTARKEASSPGRRIPVVFPRHDRGAGYLAMDAKKSLVGNFAEPFYLLTYDEGMEQRLKGAPPFAWNDLEEREWRAYLLLPRFEAFESEEPARLTFSRDLRDFDLTRPGGGEWLTGVPLVDEQPTETESGGTSIRIYRRKEGGMPILFGMITNLSEGTERWFFAHPSSWEGDGK
jgi:hypothetical protein